MRLIDHAYKTFKKAKIEAHESVMDRVSALNDNTVQKLRYKSGNKDRLQAIADIHAKEGLLYDGSESFFDALDKNGADCQGNSFLYSLALDDVSDSNVNLTTFHTRNQGQSHIALGLDGQDQIWETTKPGFISHQEISSIGYPIIQQRPFETRFDIPDAISVSHLHSHEQPQELVDFIDTLSIGDQKYPSPIFYLKQHLKALDTLFNNAQISVEDFVSRAGRIVSKLHTLDPFNIHIIAKKAQLLRLEGSKQSINEALDLLSSVDLETVKVTAGQSAQNFFYIFAEISLLKFIELAEERYKNMAIDFFKQAHQFDHNKALTNRSKDSLKILLASKE